MTLAADVLFRWTDDSFAITGWGGVFLFFLIVLIRTKDDL